MSIPDIPGPKLNELDGGVGTVYGGEESWCHGDRRAGLDQLVGLMPRSMARLGRSEGPAQFATVRGGAFDMSLWNFVNVGIILFSHKTFPCLFFPRQKNFLSDQLVV